MYLGQREFISCDGHIEDIKGVAYIPDHHENLKGMLNIEETPNESCSTSKVTPYQVDVYLPASFVPSVMAVKRMRSWEYPSRRSSSLTGSKYFLEMLTWRKPKCRFEFPPKATLVENKTL